MRCVEQAPDVPILVAARLFKPLENPSANGVKYFATTDILELVKNRYWLVRITNSVCQHWQGMNARKAAQAQLAEVGRATVV